MPDTPSLPRYARQAAMNLTGPVDIIMSDSPAGAFAILTADVALSPLNGSEPPPLAFVITAQVCVQVQWLLALPIGSEMAPSIQSSAFCTLLC